MGVRHHPNWGKSSTAEPAVCATGLFVLLLCFHIHLALFPRFCSRKVEKLSWASGPPGGNELLCHPDPERSEGEGSAVSAPLAN